MSHGKLFHRQCLSVFIRFLRRWPARALQEQVSHSLLDASHIEALPVLVGAARALTAKARALVLSLARRNWRPKLLGKLHFVGTHGHRWMSQPLLVHAMFWQKLQCDCSLSLLVMGFKGSTK